MIAIFFYGKLAQIGGPSGYLFNLQKSIDINKNKYLKILSLDGGGVVNSSSAISRKIKKIIPFPIKKFIVNRRIKKLFYENKKYFLTAEAIHFHNTRDLYIVSKLFSLKEKKIFLTSHSPELPHEELANSLMAQGYSGRRLLKEVEYQKKIDEYAFCNSDVIVFPCEGAVDPYRIYFSEKRVDSSKIDYVLTACPPLEYKFEKKDFYKKNNIDPQKKIVAYIGRKNNIKGYDIFCEVAKKFINNDDYLFVAAGLGDIKSPEIKNFIDIGWTDDPGSLVQAAHVILVPNRNTYFDIGVLQYLSIGKYIVTTRTGGNKFFCDKEVDVVFADNEDIETYINAIISFDNMGKSFRNINFYNELFRISDFSENYLEIYRKHIGISL